MIRTAPQGSARAHQVLKEPLYLAPLQPGLPPVLSNAGHNAAPGPLYLQFPSQPPPSTCPGVPVLHHLAGGRGGTPSPCIQEQCPKRRQPGPCSLPYPVPRTHTQGTHATVLNEWVEPMNERLASLSPALCSRLWGSREGAAGAPCPPGAWDGWDGDGRGRGGTG